MPNKHQVIIALGSNTDQEYHLRQAVEILQTVMSHLHMSRALWTEPIGLVSDRFLNQLVSGQTQLDLRQLTETAKHTERLLGRTADRKTCGLVDIDIDILEYDGRRMHAEDWMRGYIQDLLPDIMPQQ